MRKLRSTDDRGLVESVLEGDWLEDSGISKELVGNVGCLEVEGGAGSGWEVLAVMELWARTRDVLYVQASLSCSSAILNRQDSHMYEPLTHLTSL